MITAKLIQTLSWCDPEEWATELSRSCERFDINNKNRIAMFLANTGHETNGGRVLRENLNYRPLALVAQWPKYFSMTYAEEVGRTDAHPADQKAIAEAAYNGRMGNKFPGDGWRFIGRGLMQTTGRYNYEKLSEVTGIPLDDLPEWLETKQGAAESAACFWYTNGCNELADAGAVDKCRIKINGGLIGIQDVRDRYIKALGDLS
jgi:putative chitinase